MTEHERVVLLQSGSLRLPPLDGVGWVDGALADHLTSYGGVLGRETGQATVLDWIAAGATASHGSVSEPCNHLQKFPHPQWLLLHYLQGSTAIEAYWKSVLWPQQSLVRRRAAGRAVRAALSRAPRDLYAALARPDLRWR